MTLNKDNLFGDLPTSLKDELIETYNRIAINFRESRWEPSELNGGKLCEVVYTILNGFITGSYPSSSSNSRNMVNACKALEQAPASIPRSIRIQIPRMIVALYEIRNNRGVGHVGGDVNPNEMDAFAVLRMSKWIVAELIRVFHQLDVNDAQNAVESITERTSQIIWEVNGKRRVLMPRLPVKKKVLLLLYQSSDPVLDSDLIDWTEYSNPSVFRKNILQKLHKQKFVEYEQAKGVVEISPLGIQLVEKNMLTLGLKF